MFRKIYLIFTIIFISSFLYSQENIKTIGETVKDKSEGDPVVVSGKIYFQWEKDIKNSDDSKNKHTFSLGRFYLTASKKISDVFSLKATSDIGKMDSYDDSDNKSTTTAYEFYMKNAYIQMEKKFNNFSVKSQSGLIGTPITGLFEKLSDYRWVYNDYFNKASSLNAGPGETTADLGVNLTLNILEKISITGAYMNGEGFKDVSEDSGSGKAYYGILDINPIKELHFYGFGRYEDVFIKSVEFATDDETLFHYGGGAAVKLDLIKIGGHYIMGESKINGTSINKYRLFDSWINVNLDSKIKIPILFMGRYAFGETKEITESKTTLISGGAGYKFNKFFRLLAYYEYSKIESAEKSNQSFYIKSEGKF